MSRHALILSEVHQISIDPISATDAVPPYTRPMFVIRAGH
jgi:hypothetical protein